MHKLMQNFLQQNLHKKLPPLPQHTKPKSCILLIIINIITTTPNYKYKIY
ncbi:hypothetical protein BbiDN127_D0001 (plasmid) [Borreliella bissettiae DN127]|uniref:Uncharacterized protein n=1 Tax=Borrelia bissettiae (strain DSM 17990 / CIP 109136 / DN127) TaxID=521010 RepID=G0ANX9_BORBD|nr:hypothetical protein BbiDN127_D0001 [Borreliella bissettiae DN127]